MSDGHQEKKALRKPFASHQLYDSNIDTELKDVEGKQANSLTPVKNHLGGTELSFSVSFSLNQAMNRRNIHLICLLLVSVASARKEKIEKLPLSTTGDLCKTVCPHRDGWDTCETERRESEIEVKCIDSRPSIEVQLPRITGPVVTPAPSPPPVPPTPSPPTHDLPPVIAGEPKVPETTPTRA
ncbi:hypothetical protein Q1695_005260 [Nippostrongylus brasiliensis]|nr:hypothetical protein Q1695_005260 [Nippostrongylus brasiliensis]